MPASSLASPFAPAQALHNLLLVSRGRRTLWLCLAASAGLVFPLSTGAQVAPQPRAAAPVLSLSSGTYSGPQTVSITDTTPGAVIYYSSNGAYADTTSLVYSSPITVSSSEIVVAIAVAPGYANSDWSVGRYLISSSTTSWMYSIAGNGSPGYSGDGADATLAGLSSPLGVAVDSSGIVYVADTNNNVVRKISLTGIITTIAGTGVPGHTGDGGPATSAELNQPRCIAVDPSGNVYVTSWFDLGIRKIAAATGIITTPAPLTSATGYALATDAQGNLYIDSTTVIQKLTVSTSALTNIAGGGSVYGDNGPATSAAFVSGGLAIDQAGNLYISDWEFNSVRKVNSITGIITTVAGGPSATVAMGDGGLAINAKLYYPGGVAVDQAGNVYIADFLDKAVRKVSPNTGIITTIAGNWTWDSFGGDGDPATSVAEGFYGSLTVDTAGNLYFPDESSRVQKITLPAPPPASPATPPVFSLSAGTYPTVETVTVSDATPGASIYLSFNNDPPHTLYSGYYGPVNVTGSATITAVAVAPGYLPSAPVQTAYTITTPPTSVISTVAGVGYPGSSPSGVLATSATLVHLECVALDQAGNLYFSEYGGNTVRMISAATGVETILAGTGTAGFTGDGIAATASELNYPTSIALDKAGNLYITDSGNNRIRRVAAGTGLISTVAGPGVAGTLGDSGPATSAYIGPSAIALDSPGNLYIADAANNRVRMVAAATGIITTVAGNGTLTPFGGDGGLATAANVRTPYGLGFDAVGNLYIQDGTSRIRKVNAITGIITTIAGNGIASSSKYGSLATATPIFPEGGSGGIASDKAGNIFFSNTPSSVAKVDAATGVIISVAGNGYSGFSGDGGSATMAGFDSPQGVAVDPSGNLYIADYDRIRKVTSPGLAPAPVFNLAGGAYHTPQSLTLTDTLQGATIYYTYTANGATPTTASTLYTGPITINTTGIVEAIAVDPGYTQSPTSAKAYTYSVLPVAAAPVFNLAGGTYHSPQMLTITDTTPGAAIHYTTNGTTPTAGSTLYTGPITIASTETVEAVAIATGYSPSPIGSKAYSYLPYPPATAPSFSLAGGTYNTPQTLTLTDSTPGATIFYTTNGTTPTSNSTPYIGKITVASTELVKAVAIAPGYLTSPVSAKAYTYSPSPLAAAPYFSLAGGHYTTPQMLTLTDSTPGAAIYYTTNGTTPTTASTRYMGPLTISTTETVIAIAAASGYNNSNPSAKAYTIP